MAGIFKAYDIRGTYPDQIAAPLAARIAAATVEVLKAKRLVVGRDMRESGETTTDSSSRTSGRMTTVAVTASTMPMASTPGSVL